MTPIRMGLVVASLLVATLAMEEPAQAYRALQYRAQGHGRYVNSSGTPKQYGHAGGFFGHHRHHHRRHMGR